MPAERIWCSAPCRPTNSSWTPSRSPRTPRTWINASPRWWRDSVRSSTGWKPSPWPSVSHSPARPTTPTASSAATSRTSRRFREGVALGPFLEAKFGIPVFINNDGDLFAYGEALGGALPEVNARLEELGCPKKYKNLIGYTFGTGLGIGVVVNGRLNRGDNSCVETFCLKHKKMPDIIVEDGAAIRAVKRVYGELTGNPDHGLEPKDICDIADGKRDGDREAARKAFAEMGEIAGDAMATAVTLIDGLIVIGGGVTGARRWIMPTLFEELRSKIHTISGDELNRVQMKVYDLDNEEEFREFAKGSQRPLKVYGTDRYVAYDPQKRIGVMISKLGASKAISVGAYAFALSQLDSRQ